MSDLSGDNGTEGNEKYVPPMTYAKPENEDGVKYARFKDILREGVGFTNPRVKVGAVKIREIADSIRSRLAEGRRGLRNPLVVWETVDAEGKDILLLVGGGRRHMAIEMLVEANEAGVLENKVPYIPFKGDLKAAKAEALADNLHREDLTSYEMASAMYDLTQLGMEQKEIAQKIGKSPSYVSVALGTYNKCTTAVRKAWAKGEIPQEAATDLSKLEEDEQEAALNEQLSEREDGSRSGAKAARKAAKQRTNKTERATVKELTEVMVLGEGYDKDEGYIHGMMDAIKFAMGGIAIGQFAKPWKEFVKEKTQAAKAKVAKDDDEEPKRAEPVVKRKPGRPRKVEAVAADAPVKRGPGRPRKVVAGDAEPVVKRGPGRPRKVVVDDDE